MCFSDGETAFEENLKQGCVRKGIPMKHKLIIITIVLFLIVCSGSCFANSLFDEIMSLPDSSTDQADTTVDFDDFISDFIYYCEAWGISFDKTDKQTLKNDDSGTVIVLDGVEFDISRGDEDLHPINRISTGLGTNKTDYSSTVKMLAIIAALEFGRPSSAAERSSILSQIQSECEDNMEMAFSMAKYDIPVPSLYPSEKHCFTIEYDEDEGYEFIAILTDGEEEKARENEIPVEVVSAKAGDSAMFIAQNNSDEAIIEITFRIRGYDSDGNAINNGTEEQSDPLPSMNLFSASFDDSNKLEPGGRFNADLSMGKQAALADKIELAVQGYTTENGSSYVIPESQLHWFSSENGYGDGIMGSFLYEYPPQSVFEKAGSISLGLSTEAVFPEDRQEITGYLIDAIGAGLISSYEVQVGDVIYGANDVLIYDDPFAIEKAMAEYVDGKDMALMVKRDDECRIITVPA